MSSRLIVAVFSQCFPFVAITCLAAPPELQPGTCTYLVGAPPGAVAAASEERFDGSFVQDVCNPVPTLGAGAFGANSVQLHFFWPGGAGNRSCLAQAWTGHEFSVAGTGNPVRARIDLSGFVDGTLQADGASQDVSVLVEAVVAERDPQLAVDQVIARSPLFSRTLDGARYEIASAFEETLEVMVVPGHSYSVKMLLTGQAPGTSSVMDFGPPGNGQGARYDAIEVCIDAPPVANDPRIDDLATLDLEERLYHGDCFPGIWMPAANGGLLESARQLVVTRIDEAVLTGDPNVNARNARLRILAANGAINAHQYQKACKSLSEALHFLTSP